MTARIAKRRFSVDDYYRMAQAGILRPGDRVELIEGEIVEMSPIGHEHAWCVNRLTRVFSERLAARAVLERNRASLNPGYLLKRVLTENLEERASSVRFFDLVPAIPRVGPSLTRAAVEHQLRKNPPRGALP